MVSVNSQTNPTETKKAKLSLKTLKDSLDGKLDVSSFLMDYHGFIPMPQIITEPAVGGFGVMLTPIFITPNKTQIEGQYIPPDITLGLIGYTANKSWGFGAIRIASLPKHHLKYRVGLGYGNVNMDFYRNISMIGERDFGFNFKSIVGFGSALRQVGKSDLYLGLEYLYMKNDISPRFQDIELPDFVTEKDLKRQISTIGLVLEFDKRDNVFTPDKGWYIISEFQMNDGWTGSDYTFQNFNTAILKYFKVSPNWVSGFRFETKFQFGDAPFYLKPGISMRGVPISRYQGDQSYVLETEQRYDFTTRWSAVGFTGLAKAPTEEVPFADAKLIYNYGGGFRYLIARKLKIRCGLDFAWSNGNFGWYVVFGSSWNNRN